MSKYTGQGETAREAVEALAFMIADGDVGEELKLTVVIRPARVKDYENHIDVNGFEAFTEIP